MEATIIKPASDTTQYEAFTLPNQLQCLLCYSPRDEQSYFSLSVGVGFAHEKPERIGIPHFIEHLIFLGSEKYPDEDDFDQYMSQNGGSTNAMTDNESTTYFFSVVSSSLEGGLDRLSQFIISPKFGVNQIDKEMKALESEFKLSLSSDSGIQNDVLFTNSNPNSNFIIFQGNKASLGNPKAKEALLEFFHSKYSSNIMKIALHSNLPIEKQKELLLKTFGNIKNKNLPSPHITSPKPFEPPYIGRIFRVVPSKKHNKLTLEWYFPSYYKDTTKSLIYIQSLLGHEGPNSLLAHLKKVSLATELVAAVNHLSEVQTILEVTITLTKNGIASYIDVLDTVYMYINQIKKEGVKQYFADEIKILGNLTFQNEFADNLLDLVNEFSVNLFRYPIERILIGPYATLDLDISMVQDTMKMLTPYNSDIILLSKKFASEAKLSTKYMKCKYCMDEIPDYLAKKWEKMLPDTEKLSHPPPNSFLPKSLNILPKCDANPPPTLLMRNSLCECYYRPECNYSSPFTNISIDFITNSCQVNTTPLGAAFLTLWKNFIKEYINEELYMANEARNEFVFLKKNNGKLSSLEAFTIAAKGFSASLANLLCNMFNKIKQCPYDTLECTYNHVYRKLCETFTEHNQKSPLTQCSIMEDALLKSTEFSYQDIENTLKTTLNFATFVSLAKSWLDKARTRWLIIGSISKEESINIVNMITSIMNYSPLPISEIFLPCFPKIAPSCQYTYTKIGDDDLDTVGVSHSVFVNEKYAKGIIHLLSHFVLNEYFVEQRTKKQLGYEVISFESVYNDVGLISFQIRSSDHLPEEIVIENMNFFDFIMVKVNAMSEEDFNNHVKSAIVLLTEPKNCLENLSEHYYQMFNSINYEFNHIQKAVEELKAMKLTDLKECVQETFGTYSRQLVVEAMNKEKHNENSKLMQTANERVEKAGLRRASLMHYRMLALTCDSYPNKEIYRYAMVNQ